MSENLNQPNKTIKAWLDATKTRLSRTDAELILLFALKRDDRTFLVAHDDYVLSKKEEDIANYCYAERRKGVPLAYILKKKYFYGREFYVDESVLIPRPETEDIIDIVNSILEKQNIKDPLIYDVGTGSGCIAITMKLENPEATIIAIDNSADALHVTEKNCKKYQLKIPLVRSDLLNSVTGLNPDIIVANLPYVDIHWSWLNKTELEHEPKNALFAGNHGLALIFRLIDQITLTKRTKNLILEADPCQHKEIINYTKKKGLRLAEARNFILYFVSE